MNLFLRGTGTDPVPAGEQQTANSEALAAETCGGFFCSLRIMPFCVFAMFCILRNSLVFFVFEF